MLTKTIMLGAALACVTGAANAKPRTQKPKPATSLSEVHFRFDSSALPADVKARLREVVRFADEHPSERIVLDAHCDPIGTAHYNVGLAIRRAAAVEHELVAMGVPAEQIVFAIYGEDGEHRATYADDRRVDLWPSRDSLAMLIDHTFAGHGTAVTWGQPMTWAQVEAAPEPIARR